MADDGDNVQKVYVNPEGVAVMKCPACDAIKSADVGRLKSSGQHVIKVRCTCQKVFTVGLEFRKFYRKDTKLAGEYQLLTGERSSGKMMVLNVSKGGIGAQIVGLNRCRIGDELRLSFNLDDRHHSMINKRAVVRLIKQSYIGCEFLDANTADKALGFYLMV